MDGQITIDVENIQRHIKIFDIFRGLFILTIFFSHLHFLANTNLEIIYHKISYARLGVDYFFIMSGFVLEIGYQEKFCYGVSKRSWLTFIEKRISKIYLPYIICLFIGMIWCIYTGRIILASKDFIIRFLISVPLLQSVVPFGNYANSFNGVSWFLSCIFVFYIITPVLLYFNCVYTGQ